MIGFFFTVRIAGYWRREMFDFPMVKVRSSLLPVLLSSSQQDVVDEDWTWIDISLISPPLFTPWGRLHPLKQFLKFQLCRHECDSGTLFVRNANDVQAFCCCCHLHSQIEVFVCAPRNAVYLCLDFQDVLLQLWAGLNPEMQIGSVERAECP